MTLKKIHTTESSTPKHFMLNNLLNIPKDGKIQLDKDKEAVYSYFIEDINKNTRHFGTLKEKIDFLVDEGYIRKDLIELYDFDFIKSLFKYLYDTKFRFNTFMGRLDCLIFSENQSQLAACSGKRPVCLKLKGFKLNVQFL